MRLAILLLMMTVCVFAQVHVQGSYKLPSGSSADCKGEATPSAPFSYAGSPVAVKTVTFAVTNGVFDVTLYPTPSKVTYLVKFSCGALAKPHTEVWKVPQSATPLSWSQVFWSYGGSYPQFVRELVAGQYCISVAADGTVSLTTCSSGGVLSWSSLTSSQWASMTQSQWQGLSQ